MATGKDQRRGWRWVPVGFCVHYRYQRSEITLTSATFGVSVWLLQSVCDMRRGIYLPFPRGPGPDVQLIKHLQAIGRAYILPDTLWAGNVGFVYLFGDFNCYLYVYIYIYIYIYIYNLCRQGHVTAFRQSPCVTSQIIR